MTTELTTHPEPSGGISQAVRDGWIIALRNLKRKTLSNPWKKQDNIPL